MQASVVREGTVYSAPGSEGHGVAALSIGDTLEVTGQFREGRWVEVRLESGQLGFTKSHRLCEGTNGVRLDHYYGYTGFAQKVDRRPEGSRKHLPRVREQSYDMVVRQAEVNDLVDAVGALAESLEPTTIEPSVPVQAAILDAGSQSVLPTQEGARGILEPGNGCLAMFDRWMMSKERRAALKTVNDPTQISQARAALMATTVRCAVLGFAIYGALTVAAKFLP